MRRDREIKRGGIKVMTEEGRKKEKKSFLPLEYEIP
jgi:hypothetical protein